MKSSRSRTVAAAGLAALALTLSACSGGGGGGGGDDGDGGGDAKGDSSEEPELGPLDEYFEEMYGEYDEAVSNAQMMEVEEITAECMRDQGFEYTPVDWSAMPGDSMRSEDLGVEWGTIEFAEQYGYGATTDPWGTADEDAAPGDAEDEFVDPNQALVEAMSETERDAYHAALYGAQILEDSSDSEEPIEEYDWEESGCSGLASHKVYDEGTGMDDEEFTALQDEMSTMWESIPGHPRIVSLNGEWSSCMADAGFAGLAAVGDAENTIYEQTDVIWEGAYSDIDPEASDSMTEEDYQAIEESIQDDLAEITPDEIETAVADFTCREEVGYQEVEQEVSFELQQAFVDSHKAELDAWLAAYQESEAAQG